MVNIYLEKKLVIYNTVENPDITHFKEFKGNFGEFIKE